MEHNLTRFHWPRAGCRVFYRCVTAAAVRYYRMQTVPLFVLHSVLLNNRSVLTNYTQQYCSRYITRGQCGAVEVRDPTGRDTSPPELCEFSSRSRFPKAVRCDVSKGERGPCCTVKVFSSDWNSRGGCYFEGIVNNYYTSPPDS